MNNKAVTISLAAAVFAVWMVNSYVTSIEEEQKRKFGAEVLVLKAKRDIKESETIDESMIGPEAIPKRFLEPAAISYDSKEGEVDAIKSVKRLTGTVALVPVKKGEQLTYNKITEPSIRTGLAPQVAPGRRAMSIPVNEVSGVGKLIKPGDRVDLISVIDSGTGRQNRIVKTLLQDIVLLAVGRNVTNNIPRVVDADPMSGKERVRSLTEDSNFASVTVEVEPSQAQLLSLVLSNPENTIFVSLRNNDDSDRVSLPAINLSEVMGGVRVPAQQGAAPQAPIQQQPGGRP